MTDTKLHPALERAFALQDDGKHREAYSYFLTGVRDVCFDRKYDCTGYLLGLLPKITDPENVVAVTKSIANHTAFHDLTRAQSYLGTFPTQAQNDVWFLQVLHAETPAEEKRLSPFADKVLTIKTDLIRDIEIIDHFNFWPKDRLEELIEAIVTPELQEHAKQMLVRKRKSDAEAAAFLEEKNN